MKTNIFFSYDVKASPKPHGHHLRLSRLRQQLMLLSCLVIGLGCQAMAYAEVGFIPRQGIHVYGQGVWYAEPSFIVYSQPNDTAQQLGNYHWSPQDGLNVRDDLSHQTLPATQIFLACYPAVELGLMAVIGETNHDWLEVVINQQSGKTGWVRRHATAQSGYLPPVGSFQTWYEFMMTHAKPAGIYWMEGVPESVRTLHSQPDDLAKQVSVFYLQRQTVLHLRGNWLLMQALDLEHNTPIGWVRWREENGQLLLFPNIDSNADPWRQAHQAQPTS